MEVTGRCVGTDVLVVAGQEVHLCKTVQVECEWSEVVCFCRVALVRW